MKIVVCDDRDEILVGLRQSILRLYGNSMEVETTRMPDTLLSEWKQHPAKTADILFMDIEYPYTKKSGIAIAKEIQDIYPNIKVIFITGNIQHAQDIFHANPSSFLVKPFDDQAVSLAMDKVMNLINKEKEEIISFKSRGGLVKIPSSSILYIESKGHNVVIHCDKREETFRMKLAECVNLLPDDFWMIHQSYIVHATYIRKLMKDGMELENGVFLPISRSRYLDIKDKFFDSMEKNNIS